MSMNRSKLKLNTPAEIVNTLYGIGVNAAIKRKISPYEIKYDFAVTYLLYNPKSWSRGSIISKI